MFSVGTPRSVKSPCAGGSHIEGHKWGKLSGGLHASIWGQIEHYVDTRRLLVEVYRPGWLNDDQERELRMLEFRMNVDN